jgi:hypothetical protein
MDARAKIDAMLAAKRKTEIGSRENREDKMSISAPSTIALTDILTSPVNARACISTLLEQKRTVDGSVKPTIVMDNGQTKPMAISCPQCSVALTLKQGIYLCPQCTKRYVERSDKVLLNCQDLAYGYCQCCELCRPLIRLLDQPYLCCSVSGEEYVSTANGYQRLSQLPFGLCSCCSTPQPLLATATGIIHCLVSNKEYICNVDGSVVPKPMVFDTAQSIEAALNDGHAAFYYGGFMAKPEKPQTAIKRRR